MGMAAFKNGDRVAFANGRLHETSPGYYPPPGTVGVYQGGGWVQWPEGTTIGDGRWHAPAAALKEGGRRKIIITRGSRDAPRAEFTPHLVMHGETVGIIGTPTRFRDILGRPLAVGDVVEIFNRTSVSYGDNVLCDDGRQYVMGIKSSCDDRIGSAGYWRLLKKRGYDDVKNGERIDGVVYVTRTGRVY
ncbi:hypothetical protein SAMN02745823_03784 [Sporobacter termitidis DSM 10068]|uniref:Uncharacterized protein n=1 Tax=Sporobacter termitidis DSM 10068 TaxID=1123282 RepID=A0A1M5ZIZ9_9FIRM|nr:hypothetical protein [Sporobacter termitidis]SHI23913.1 hypothetical protein SAMN02745823_03784 [Sporobacter termitidis DSM 10068]